MTTYLTGAAIQTETVTLTTARGDVSLTLLRNARLGVNGYLPASTHALALRLPGGQVGCFSGLVAHAQHGLCLSVDMGRILIRVPAAQQAAVRALVAERDAHNAATAAADDAADLERAAHVAGVHKMMEG